MTVTKASIAEALRMELGLTGEKSREAVQTVIELMRRELAAGEQVLISNFGKFYLQEKNERLGRDPSTGKPKMLRARRILRFKCAQRLRRRIDGSGRRGKDR